MTRVRTSQLAQTGATTGQGLVWNGTDWLPANITDPNSLSKQLVDAKGDLLVGTADNVIARLPVGLNSQVLTADSTAVAGIKWAPPAQTGHTIQDEHASLPQRSRLDFVGATVTATDDPANDRTIVTINAAAVGYVRYVDLNSWSAAGYGSASASMAIKRGLAASSAGLSTFTATARMTRGLALSTGGTGAFTATASLTRGLAAIFTGVSTMSADAFSRKGLAMSAAGGSSVVADLSVTNAPGGYTANYSDTY